MRARTRYRITGTSSGRTSTSSVKPPDSITAHGLAFQTITHYEDANLDTGVGLDLRSQFIADPGYVFVEYDYSQAEDRVVQVLAQDWDALKDMERTDYARNQHKLKDDRHTKTTMMIMDKSFDSVTSGDRQIGKKVRHAGNYNMGKHACMINLAGDGVFMSEWKCGQLLDKFHRANPLIRDGFHKDVIAALTANDCILYSPHGRKHIFFDRWGDELFKQAFSFIPQATVSDANKFAMLRIREQLPIIEFEYLFESHDSALALVKIGMEKDFAKVIQKEAEELIDFKNCTLSRDYKLKIPVEFKIGNRWSELVDYKL